MLFRLLAVGDVVGAPGLDFAAKNLKRIRKELGADFVAVNGENANVVGVTPKQCDALLAAGADKIPTNSAAVADPSLIDAIAARYGSQFVVAAIDARQIDGRWQVTTHGGKRATERELFTWAREAVDRGAGEILFTSMDHDGTKNGYPCETFARLAELPVPVIASGGAGSVAHIADVLTRGRADAALAASIFHYGEIPIPRLKWELRERGIAVRL